MPNGRRAREPSVAPSFAVLALPRQATCCPVQLLVARTLRPLYTDTTTATRFLLTGEPLPPAPSPPPSPHFGRPRFPRPSFARSCGPL